MQKKIDRQKKQLIPDFKAELVDAEALHTDGVDKRLESRAPEEVLVVRSELALSAIC